MFTAEGGTKPPSVFLFLSEREQRKVIYTLTVKTKKRSEFIDITSQVQSIVAKSTVHDGICYLYVPHTTAGITINEHADPSVVSDIQHQLSKLIPHEAGYAHMEGNADAHIKATLTGSSISCFIEQGKLVLGTWQGIFFCEYDGPRTRNLLAKVLET
jgi:secondary thiamine-phosphate synthase enzyme